MSSPVENRRLAAIMFSDIVGYTDLSHRDESLALHLLAEHRELIRPLIELHHGREVKTTGDGFLIEFRNAWNATACAIEIQKTLIIRNKNNSINHQIEVRIGIHIGDIIELQGDVYGDRVNIAARLMQIAKPGRICISGLVMDQVRDKIPHWVSTLGPIQLKGISDRISAYAICVQYLADTPPPWIYRLRTVAMNQRQTLSVLSICITLAALGWAVSLKTSSMPVTEQLKLDDSKRIAVLPLQGIGLKEEEEYLPDGITDELIGSLSKLSQIKILSKDSTRMLKNSQKSPTEIGSLLKVASYIQGSVQKLGSHLRIHIQLIDVTTQENLWSKDFEGDFSKTFDVQKNIASHIADQFSEPARSQPRIQSRGLASVPSTSPDSGAYQHYLKGKYAMQLRTREGFQKSLKEFEASLKLDPQFAPAYATTANVYGLMDYYGYIPAKSGLEKGERYAKQALELDPLNAEALIWFAEKFSYSTNEWDRADEYYRRAIEVNPNLAFAHQWYGEILAVTERFDEAAVHLKRALELDPLSQTTMTAIAFVDYYQGRYDLAIQAYQKAMQFNSKAVLPYVWLGKAYLAKKDYKVALDYIQKAKEISPGPMTEGYEAEAFALLGDKTKANQILTHLISLQRHEYASHYTIAGVYLALGNPKEALLELEKSIQTHESQSIALKVDPSLESLRSDPQFKKLLRLLKLPS